MAMLNNQMVQEFPFNQVREASWSIQFSCLLGPPAPVVTAARFIGWCRGAILEAALNESEKPGDFGQIIATSLRPNPGIMVNKRNHPKMAWFQWGIHLPRYMDYWDFDHVIEQQEMIYTDLYIITLASRNARCIDLQAWDMKHQK